MSELLAISGTHDNDGRLNLDRSLDGHDVRQWRLLRLEERRGGVG